MNVFPIKSQLWKEELKHFSQVWTVVDYIWSVSLEDWYMKMNSHQFDHCDLSVAIPKSPKVVSTSYVEAWSYAASVISIPGLEIKCWRMTKPEKSE